MAYAPALHEKYPLPEEVLRKYAPPTWTPMSPSTAVELVNLPPGSQEFQVVFNKIRSSMPAINVKKIVRVQNPYLWGVYLSKRAENPNVPEITLFTATEESRVPFVTTNNFEFNNFLRLGVRFGRDAKVAEMCSAFPRTAHRAIIQARVLDTPPSATSYSPPHFRPVVQVYLKEEINECYPEYVVYHYFKNPYAILNMVAEEYFNFI